MSIKDGTLKTDSPWTAIVHNGPICPTCRIPYTGRHRCTPSALRSRAASLRLEADQLEARASKEETVKEHT